MSELRKYHPIKKDVATGDDLDYGFLRKKGREYIEQLARNVWTDYNVHDPGITLLEMLSYALTDLAARIEMPIEDLLTPKEQSAPKIEEQFFTASRILTTKPVSEADYRKLFIDIEGVKNCWLKTYPKTVWVDCKNGKLSYNEKDFESVAQDDKKQFDLKGLYTVIVDFDEPDHDKFPTEMLVEAEKERIKKEIRSRFHSHRNLCEDLIAVREVGIHPVSVCASIELEPEADEELVHAKIIHAIDHYFSPSLRFYSLRQMKEKGYSSEEIFEGPLLENGFIDPGELESSALRTEVRLSDLMQLIMAIDGVKIIRDISIKDCHNPDDEADEWLICVEPGKKPIRCADSAYSYFKSVLPVNLNKKRVDLYLDAIKKAEKEAEENAKIGMEIAVPQGIYPGTSETTTIQNDFPDTYGIGRNGLPAQVPTARKAQAKQLKAYLLFFDQVLATYFAHLEKVKDQLSVNHQLKQTYFTQAVQDIRDFEELVSDYPAGDPEQLTAKLLGELDNSVQRNNRLLDHLMARFAEKFTAYAFLMKQLNGNYADKAVLQSKQSFLRDYDVTSRERGSAFNYYRQPAEMLWDTENVAGVEKRIARLTGIKDYRRRDLSGSFIELYDLVDSDGETVYRWRIYDQEKKIVLSATENYHTPHEAHAEVYHALVKIVETSPETIEAAFESGISDEAVIGNFEIQISDSGKYSFNVLDREADPDSADRVIARQYTYHETQEEIKEAILALIAWMTGVFTEEGMFLIEHILLRPDVTTDTVPQDQFMTICGDDCTGCHPVDPYSFRVTVVLPGWTYRFANADFRNFLAELIRKELPAHLLARICWVGYQKGQVPDEENDMVRLEKAYKAFLLAKTNLEQKQDEEKLKELINILNELSSVYPAGKLIDCDEEDETLEGKIILGRTNIGNI